MYNGNDTEIARGSRGFFLHIGKGKHPITIKISKELLRGWISEIDKIERGD